MSRLRSGELLAVAGLALTIVGLVVDGVGWLAAVVAVAAVLAAAWLIIATVAASTARALAAGVATAVIGPLAVIALLIGGAWVTVIGAVVITVGAWRALADERTGAPQSAYTPPAPRPAPPAT